jgi:hypothetical protein
MTPFLGGTVKISDQKREQISRLITEGENLNLQDLEALYRWIDDSYEALEFSPIHRRRFDDYCRSSFDSNSARTYVGVWMLRLALEEASPYSKDHKNYLASCTNVPS